MTPAITPDPTQQAPPAIEPEVPTFGEDNRELDADLVKALKGLTEKFQGQDKYARRSEVVEARRQRFYDRSDQYIYWDATSFVFVPVTGGGGLQVGSDSVDMPRYTDVYNIYHPFGRSIVAVLSQNPPGVNFEPVDPTASADITAAQAAEKYKWVIDRANDRKSLQQKIARLFWTDGRVCLYTRTEKDGDGNPQQFIDCFGVLEHKCPIIAESQDEMPYQVISDEIDICKAKDDCDWAASKIKEGESAMGESAYERMARLGVLQGTKLLMQAGDAYAHIVTRHHVFLRPSAFQEAPKEVQEQLKEAFPDGAHVKFQGGAYCGSWNESMDDHLAIGHAEDGDGQSRPSWGKGMVPLQDAYNNYKNMRREYHDYGIPITIMDQAMFDADAMRSQISEPGNTIFTTETVPPGTPISNYFGQTEALEPPADLVEAENDLRGPLGEFISAAQPSLFGAQLKGNDTAAAYAMSREQAMGIIGTPWGRLQELFAKAYKQAVMCAARDQDESDTVNIAIPGKRGVEKLDSVAIADLQVGNFHCFPDTDSSFPETWSAKRSAYQQFMQAAEFNPVLMEASTEPDNLALGQELSGLDLTIPAVEARNKQLREIDELLANVPQPPSQQAIENFAHLTAVYKTALQAGMQATQPPPKPPGPESSVPVDPIYDFHKYEFQEVQAWLNSEERVEEEKKGNQAGIENVRLHGIEHQAAMVAQMPPPMPVPAPAPSGGPPKAAGPKPPPPSPGQPSAQPVM